MNFHQFCNASCKNGKFTFNTFQVRSLRTVQPYSALLCPPNPATTPETTNTDVQLQRRTRPVPAPPGRQFPPGHRRSREGTSAPADPGVVLGHRGERRRPGRVPGRTHPRPPDRREPVVDRRARHRRIPGCHGVPRSLRRLEVPRSVTRRLVRLG